jgi:hypothetical protein
MTDLEALEGLTAGDVIVFQFGETVWVGAVVSDPETQSMYRDNNPTRVVRTTAQQLPASPSLSGIARPAPVRSLTSSSATRPGAPGSPTRRI